MNFEYRTEVIKNGKNEILVPRLTKELTLIETFLYADVQSYEGSGKWLLETFDKVLSSESPFQEITGNVCNLEINKDFTVVTDSLADDEDIKCVVPTEQLKDLINTWLKDKEQFQTT